MIGKKINQLATELAPVSTDLTIIGDPISGVSKKITLAQLGAIFSGAISFYTNLAGFPATGDINVIYCAKDTQKLYLWSGSAYVEVFPSQALLDTYQLRSEKGVSNGYASLDSSGKVPISQLPSSIMEYKGTWNAATNTPTLANGTGDTGDVYICNVAGTVNFGAGPITFAVGDYVIYSGSIWQRSSGAVGTVTSVAASITGNAIGITGSPVTTSGTLAFAFAGTGAQYIKGDGTLATFPNTISQAEKLITEVYNNTGATLTKGTIVYINGGQGNLPTVTKALATGDSTSAQTFGVVQADITNMNNGYVVVAGKLSDLDTQAYTPGTQLYLSSTTAGTWTSTKQYAPAHLVYVGIVVRSHPTQGIVEVKIQNGYELDEIHDVAAQNPSNNDILQYKTSTGLWTKVAGTTSNIAEGSNLYYTDARSRAALSFTAGSGAYNSTTGVITIPTNTNQLTNGANYITLGSLSASSPLSYNNTTGAFSISQANSTTNGFLSSADWTTFNNKQNALSGTGFVKISGTTISYDNSTYLTTSAAASTYLPLVLNGSANTVDINGQQFTIQGSAGGFTSGRIIVDPVFSAIGYQNAGVFDGLKILTNGNAEFTNSGVTRFFNQVRFDSTLTNGTYTYTLPGATGTIALVGGAGVGTVTSVGLSSATSGVTIGSTPITTSGTITLAIATASGSQQGLLSSTDWTTFNNKQNALTNPVTGTGTTNYLPKFTGTSTIGNSQIFDNGTNVGINQASPTRTLDILGATGIGTVLKLQGAAGTTTYLQLAYNGATNAQSGYIGYNSSSQMQFFTNDTLRATLDASGNLMVGSTDAGNAGSINVSVGVAGTTSGGLQLWAATNQTHYIQFGDGTTGASPYTGYVGYAHSTDSLIFGTATSTKMTLTSSGNLGLGVTPSAGLATANYRLFEIGLDGGGSIYSGSNQTLLGTNISWNGGTPNYVRTGSAPALYNQANGIHSWSTAPSGTAGNAISFTQAMTLNASGNLSIGNTNDTYKLDVSGTGRFTGQLNIIVPSGTAKMQIGDGSVSGGSYINLMGVAAAKTWFISNNYNLGGGLEFIQSTANGGTTPSNTAIFSLSSTGAATFSNDIFARSGTIDSRAFKIYEASAGRGSLAPYNLVSGSGTDYSIGLFSEGELFFASGGSVTKRIVVNNSGNVGIGTTSPSALLHLAQNTTNLNLYLQNTNGSGQTWAVNSDNLGKFNIHNTSVNVFTISGTNVGIGTTSPAANLQVAAASSPTIALNLSGSATSGSRGSLAWYNSSISTVALIDVEAVTDNVATNMVFYTRPASGSLTERMRIKSNGIINLSNVPSSSAGLSSGDIYKTVAGVLMIV